MISIPPSVRISLGLASIALSILLLINLSGLLPDKNAEAITARKNLVESMALHSTLLIKNDNLKDVGNMAAGLLRMHPEVLSVGMRNSEGGYFFRLGGHEKHWTPPPGETSTDTFWRVPIFRNGKKWATLEVCFVPLKKYSLLGYQITPFTLLVTAFSLACFAGFLLFMVKTLRAIDPTSVMPSRVKFAFDTLSEGLILVDEKGKIVLANAAIAERLKCKPETLLGVKASMLPWQSAKDKASFGSLPWLEAIQTGKRIYGFPMSISREDQETRMFMVNSSPIIDGNGKTCGALTTFDDVTELEQRNTQLYEAMENLKLSRDKVQLQNLELEQLATRDPMTGCLNRRAFFARAEEMFAKTRKERGTLGCIMTDIDKFKTINDAHGHGVGDSVIRYYSEILQLSLRVDDLLCRYGGEEFCMLFPACSIEACATIAERTRRKIREQSGTAVQELPDLYIAGSFGVSSLAHGAHSIGELIDQADKALYLAKETGRNRVVCYAPSESKAISSGPSV